MINPLTGVLFGLLIYLFIKPENLLIDADTGWHLMAGKYIAQTGSVPFTNVFSYDTGSYQWYNISWLWDVIFGFVYQHGGLYGAVGATILVIVSTLLLLTRICFYRGGGIISTAEIFIMSLFTFTTSALVRPHIASYFLTALTLYFCYKLKQQKSRWPLIALPITIAIWTNMHGGFIVGYSIILAFTAEMLFKKSYPQPVLLVISCLASLAAVLLNPLGPDVFAGINRSLSGPMASHIREWQVMHDPINYIYITVFIIVFIFRRKDFSLAEIVLSFFWMVQAILSFRNLPIFTIISAPALAAALHQIVLKIKNVAPRELAYTKKFNPQMLGISLLVTTGVLALGPWPEIVGFNPDKVPNYPVKEINYVMANYPHNRFFNNYDIGGYVILGSGGKLQTFIDGRAETAFPDPVLQDYLKFHGNKKDWTQIFDKYHINGIIIAKYQDEQVDTIDADNRWDFVFEGDKALVYVRD